MLRLEFVEKVSRNTARVVFKTVDEPREKLAGKARGYRYDKRQQWAMKRDAEYARIENLRHEGKYYTLFSDELPVESYEYQHTVEDKALIPFATLLVKVAEAGARIEVSTPLYLMSNRLARKLYGFTPEDVWYLKEWVTRTLSNALDEYSQQLPYATRKQFGLAAIASRIRMYYPLASDDQDNLILDENWKPTPIKDLCDQAFDRLIENFAEYCDDGKLLHDWSAHTAGALTELARTAHGVPCAYVDPETDDVDAAAQVWTWELTRTAEQLLCYNICGDPEYAMEALSWIRHHLENLWD